MADKDAKPGEDKGAYKAPEGSSAEFQLKLDDQALKNRAETQWIVLRKEDKPKAEMFCTVYAASTEKDRPVTFVFNGGPGGVEGVLYTGFLFFHLGFGGRTHIGRGVGSMTSGMGPASMASRSCSSAESTSLGGACGSHPGPNPSAENSV